jgi:hypothetical protein
VLYDVASDVGWEVLRNIGLKASFL